MVNWRKGDPYYIVEENFVEFHHKDMWKAKHLPNELGHLDQDISK